jgi:four helix bundle protein
MFECMNVAVEFIEAMGPVVGAIGKRDPGLADQVRRASQGLVLQIAEARKRVGKDRQHLFRVAAGSGEEARAGITIARAWGYVDAASVEPALALVDRVMAMLWRLGSGP